MDWAAFGDWIIEFLKVLGLGSILGVGVGAFATYKIQKGNLERQIKHEKDTRSYQLRHDAYFGFSRAMLDFGVRLKRGDAVKLGELNAAFAELKMVAPGPVYDAAFAIYELLGDVNNADDKQPELERRNDEYIGLRHEFQRQYRYDLGVEEIDASLNQ